MDQETILYQPYDPETLAYFMGVLLEKRVKIMTRLEKISRLALIEELAAAEPGNKVQIYDRHNSTRLMDEQDLVHVEAALKRIENGSFGLCLGCNPKKRIPLEQLMAIPTTDSCVLCRNNKRKRAK